MIERLRRCPSQRYTVSRKATVKFSDSGALCESLSIFEGQLRAKSSNSERAEIVWIPQCTSRAFVSVHFGEENALAFTEALACHGAPLLAATTLVEMTRAMGARLAKRLEHSDRVIFAGVLQRTVRSPWYDFFLYGSAEAEPARNALEEALAAAVSAEEAPPVAISEDPFEQALHNNDNRKTFTVTAGALWPSGFLVESEESAEEEKEEEQDEHALAVERMVGRKAAAAPDCSVEETRENDCKRHFPNTGAGPWKRGTSGQPNDFYWKPLEERRAMGVVGKLYHWIFLPTNADLVFSGAIVLRLPPCPVNGEVFFSRQAARYAVLRGNVSEAAVIEYVRANKPSQRQCFVIDHMVVLGTIAAAMAAGERTLSRYARKEATLARRLYLWAKYKEQEEADEILFNLFQLNAWPSRADGPMIDVDAEFIEDAAEHCILQVAKRMAAARLEAEEERTAFSSAAEEGQEQNDLGAGEGERTHDRFCSAQQTWTEAAVRNARAFVKSLQ